MDTPIAPENKPVTPAETLPPTMEPKRKIISCPWFYVILITCATIVGAFLYSDYRAAHPRPIQSISRDDVPQIDTQASAITGNIETVRNENTNEATSTPSADRTKIDDGRIFFTFGSSARLFKGESASFNTQGESTILKITAVSFTDSRCPADAVCIWEGERGVELDVAREGAEDAASKISLKLKTNPSQSAKGHTFTLIAIDEEKGGTYAEVKVE